MGFINRCEERFNITRFDPIPEGCSKSVWYPDTLFCFRDSLPGQSKFDMDSVIDRKSSFPFLPNRANECDQKVGTERSSMQNRGGDKGGEQQRPVLDHGGIV